MAYPCIATEGSKLRDSAAAIYPRPEDLTAKTPNTSREGNCPASLSANASTHPNDAQSVHTFQLTLTECFSAGIEKSLQWEGNKKRVVDRKRRTLEETKSV